MSVTKNTLADKMIEDMKNGKASFQQSYKAGETRLPFNPTTGRTYSSINAISLDKKELDDKRFMTAKQATDKGYTIKEGAKPVLAHAWQRSERVPTLNEDGSHKLKEDGSHKFEMQKLEKPKLVVVQLYNGKDIEGLSALKSAQPSMETDQRAANLIKNYSQDNDKFKVPVKDTTLSHRENLSHAIDAIAKHEASKSGVSVSAADKALQSAISSHMMKAELRLPNDASIHKDITQASAKEGFYNDQNKVYKITTAAQKDKDNMLVLSRAKSMQMDKPEEKEKTAVQSLEKRRNVDVGLGRM